MEIVKRYIIKHSSGTPVNWKLEPVKSIRSAARVDDPELFNQFMNGHYKPSNPEDYSLHEIEITYREVNGNERIKELVSED